MTDFTIIRRSMTSRLFSTVTTIITVAVAVALMLTLLSMRDAGRRAFQRGAGNMHLIVSRDSSPLVSVLNGVFYANAPARPIPWAEFLRLTDPASPAALPIEWAVPIQQGDSYRALPVTATDLSFFQKFQPAPDQPWTLEAGRLFESDMEVVVGARAARHTGLRVGDTIYLTHGVGRASSGETGPVPHEHREFQFRVVGVLAPTGASHDRALFINLESAWILHAHDRRLAADPRVPLTTRDDLTDADRLITGAYLRVLTRTGQSASAVLPAVYSALRADANLTVASPSDQIASLFTIVGNIDQLFVAMAAVVMISSGIAIMLALYNSMENRRRQIAILRILGCSRPRVFGLVLTESALLGLFGAALGLLLCLAGMQVVAEVLRARLGLIIDPALDPAAALLVCAGTVALSCLAGFTPAAMAYRTSVAKNLRPIA